MDCPLNSLEIEAVARTKTARGWEVMTIATKAINDDKDKLAILKEVLTLSDDIVNVYLVKNNYCGIPDSINITEELAELYCNFYLGEEDGDDVDQAFIANSHAFARWIRARETLAYEDAAYGSYTDQHRIRPQDVL